MRGALRVESAWPSSKLQRARVRGTRALPRSARLRAPEDFAALAGGAAHWRASRQWVSLAARFEGDDAKGVRFGFTVGRRQARRAVQRAMVKRVLRESARHAAGALLERAGNGRIDIVLRLRSPLPEAEAMSLTRVKQSLRRESDSLLAQLARHLRGEGRAEAQPGKAGA